MDGVAAAPAWAGPLEPERWADSGVATLPGRLEALTGPLTPAHVVPVPEQTAVQFCPSAAAQIKPSSATLIARAPAWACTPWSESSRHPW